MHFDIRNILGGGKTQSQKPQFRDTLRAVPIFSELSRRELAAVERILHLRDYHEGELIFRQDEPGLGMYIIETGRVAIRNDESAGAMSELGRRGVLRGASPAGRRQPLRDRRRDG